MAAITTTGTLTAGNSRTFALAPGSALTLTLLPNCRVTITESPATVNATALGGNATRVHEPRLPGTFTYGPYPMGGSVVVDVGSNSGSTVTWVETSSIYSKDSSGNVTGLVGPDGAAIGIVASRYCYFHGFAGQQIVGDPKFYDLAGSNHGVFGANLSNANAWATAGYVSTIDPTGGATDSVIRIPALNFDYAGGEKLIVWWLGYATPEGSDVAMLGDGSATTTAKGVRLRMKTTGKYDLSLFGATQGFSGDSDGAVFDGTLHSLGFAFDGAAKTHGLWSDDVYHPSMGSVLQTFSSSTAFDTTNSNTFNIGSPFPASASSTTGAATKTRAMCIYRLPANETMLTVAEITALFQQLRANPSKLALATAV